MTIRDVVKMARSLTDVEGAIVDRDVGIAAFKSRLDQNEEQYLKANNIASLAPFRILSVKNAIEKPTLTKLNIPCISYERIKDTISLRDSIYGYLDNTGDIPAVVYRPRLRPCWERFTIAKELLHLYSDTASTWQDANTLITAAKQSRELIPSESESLSDETIGFYLAMEVMVPWRLREQFLSLKDKAATKMQIAKAFMVPLCIIDHMMSESCEEGSSYAGLSMRINSSI